ncbi:MAG: hypothetical protein PHE50_10730 [Dehalococcoidales bacterium]|nr:hypothetical protein [Dehalococcoidales bacterium]
MPCKVAGHPGAVALEQMRCVDRSRLLKHVGRMDIAAQQAISQTLVEMFS